MPHEHISVNDLHPTICGSHNGRFVCTFPQGHGPIRAKDPDDGEEFLHAQVSPGLPSVYWNIPTADLPELTENI